ncbi:MAG: biotin--[acetyl-CoA-carboxylase] ligase [Xanthomonadales bacterium]|jgi:BirA family biotin operon repressor/biotin-[acetyl-CoA-carboxylase] ligase|nr:biotin--[acetyl-CoA-carboxylase] ligase [Xanthomonadales bacterium]
MIESDALAWFTGLLAHGRASAPVPPSLTSLVAGMLQSSTLLPQGAAGFALNRAFAPLDASRIRAAWSRVALPRGAGRHGPLEPPAAVAVSVLPLCASTQDEARARAALELPAAAACVVLAEAQLDGRGRAGRRWDSAPLASLALTLVTDTTLPASQLPALAPALGVVLAEALAPEAPDLRLKWPNDLWRDGGKLAGLLIEAAPRADGSLRLAIGLGLNIRELPVMHALSRPVRALPGGGAVDRNALAARLIHALWRGWQDYVDHGYRAFAERYLARDLLLGQPIELRMGGETRIGIGAGLAPDGALLLQLDGRIERIVAGEVEGPVQLAP